MVNGDHGDISKITVIGNGWGRSSTVYNSFNQSNEKSNTSFEFPRNQQQYPQMLGFNLNNNQKNDSIVFDRTVGSLERGLSNLNRQKSVCLDSPNLKDGSSSLESSSHSENIPNLNINRVNTIILKKKQPHFTIITVVEDYDLQPNEEGNYNDGSSRNRCVQLFKKKHRLICMRLFLILCFDLKYHLILVLPVAVDNRCFYYFVLMNSLSNR